MTTLPLSQIRTDGGTQARARLSQEAMNDYRDAMLRGDPFPPADVFYDGELYWLADGFHRFRSALAAGRQTLDVTVHPGTRREAVLFSAGANARNSVRRTNEDKRRAVEILLRDEEWRRWSNEELARRAAVDPKTVASVRQQLRATLEIPESDNLRISSDGRTINTTHIGKSPSVPPPTEPPRPIDLFDANGERLILGALVRTPLGHEGTITAIGPGSATVDERDYDPRKLIKIPSHPPQPLDPISLPEHPLSGPGHDQSAPVESGNRSTVENPISRQPIPPNHRLTLARAAAATLFPDQPNLIDALARIALFSSRRLQPYDALVHDLQILQNWLDTVRMSAGLAP